MKKYLILFLLLLSLGSCLDHFFAPLIITGAVTNVDKDGAVFHTKITDLGNNDIAEFGFVWDTIQNPTVERAEKYIFHNRAQVGNYEAKISTCLITLKTYYVRAFIRSGNVITYGEETSFVSQGGKLPEITSISPILGNLADTLVIAGKYFSVRSSVVKINEIEAEIIRSNQDSIYIRIPSALTRKTSAISVTNLNQTTTAKDSFTLISPIINSFDAKTGTYGEAVTITGKNFMENPSSVHVYFDKVLTTHQIINDQTIRAIVPNELNKANCTISVGMNNQTTESAEKYSLSPIEINDFSPKIALTGEKITITGNNFSPIVGNNRVYIGGVLAKTNSATKNSLTVTLSLQDTAVYESRNSTLKVDVGGNIKVFNDKLLINDKWFRRANAPTGLRTENKICSTCAPSYDYKYACCFAIGKTAYIGINNKKDFWAYDTEKDSWRKLSDFPGVPRVFGTGFVYENKIYFGTGLSGYYSSQSSKLDDWWEYNPASDKWTQKATFIGGAYSTLAGYSTSTGCYLSNGFSWEYETGTAVNIWKYNPTSDVWSKEIIDLKGTVQMTSNWSFAKAVNDDVYICFLKSYPDAFIYNTKSDTFKSITSFPFQTTLCTGVSMVLNNNLYVRTSSSFYYYDRTTNSWKYTETKIYSEIDKGIAFDVNNIGFAGLGSSNHLYEFDPNR